MKRTDIATNPENACKYLHLAALTPYKSNIKETIFTYT